MPALDRSRPRNELLLDWWSLTHVAWGVGLTLLVGPFVALLALTLWEPLEVLVFSPILARRGMSFGHESLRNSLVDLVFNATGVVGATWLLLPWMSAAPLWPIPVPGM